MKKNKCRHIAKVRRFITPDEKYTIEITEDDHDLESWLQENNYSIKLFCYGIPKNSENKDQTTQLLSMTLYEMDCFIEEYEKIKKKMEKI